MTLSAQDLALDGRLSGVTTKLEPGAITAICGPNGAGKSTLLSVLAGLLEPDSGVAELGGAPLSALHPRERAKRIGYDIVMVYAGHDLSLPMHFLVDRHNKRTDEYGGSLENRVRLLRELLEKAFNGGARVPPGDERYRVVR